MDNQGMDLNSILSAANTNTDPVASISQSDPRIMLFKMKAIQAGYPPEIINSFVNQQMRVTNAGLQKQQLGVAQQQQALETSKVAETKNLQEIQKTSAPQQLSQDLQSGMSLDGAMQKYRPFMDPTDILHTFTTSGGQTQMTPKQLQDKYGVKPTAAQEKQMEPMPQQNLDELNNTVNMVNNLKKVKSLVDSGKLDSFLGPQGNFVNFAAQHGLTFLLPPEAYDASRILTLFKTQGERTAIGGRLTGYLLNRIGPAFPDLTLGKQNLSSALSSYIKNAQDQIKGIAKNKGVDVKDLPVDTSSVFNTNAPSQNAPTNSKGSSKDPLGIL